MTIKKMSRVNIEGIVLKTVATTGLLALALCAPNALQVLKQFGYYKNRKKNPKYLVNDAIDRLVKKGLLIIEKDGKNISLSKKGQITLAFLEAGKIKMRKRKWDGKWRVVIFDIPNRRTKSRDQLRYLLTKIGFHRLQRSVWVYPYESEELVTLIKLDNFLQKEVLYFVIEKLEGEQKIKSHFKV